MIDRNHDRGQDRAARSTNLAVIRGTVPHEPEHRALPSGTTVVQFDVTTCVVKNGRTSTVSVPIAWHDPSAAQIQMLVDGIDVLVVGTVRRRFFRVGGATQSRTEIVAERVIPTRRRKQISAALHDTAELVLAGLG